jgi:hypothetical protein
VRRLAPEERARLVLECWWAHDGQWFLKTAAAHGLEEAMRLNEAAIESIGRIEMRRLHAALGAPPVRTAGDLLPLVLAAQDLMGIPAEGAADGTDAFWLRETECRVWTMTVAAGLEAHAPGCRGSMRRRHGWATVFFPPERVRWERTGGPPEGDVEPCAYRFRLLPEAAPA